MADQSKADAQRRLFIVAAKVSKSDGVELDGGDPKFRELCNSSELAAMTDEEMAERLRGLIKVATDLPC
jgi:hypothetical protein